MDAEFLSGPHRTEVSRCVAGEESWSEPANTPAKLCLVTSRFIMRTSSVVMI